MFETSATWARLSHPQSVRVVPRNQSIVPTKLLHPSIEMTETSDFEIPDYKEFMGTSGKKSEFSTDVPFEILSTIRYDPLLSKTPPKSVGDITKENFFLLPEHVERNKYTIEFFRQIDESLFSSEDGPYYVDEDSLFKQLLDSFKQSQISVTKPLKIRLLLSKSGDARIELYETAVISNILCGLSEDFPESDRYDVFVDSAPVLASPFTSFKTTHRDIYTNARQKCLPGKSPREEVILVNTASEAMEGSITNIAIKSKQGVWITPKLTSGCLCGVTRHFLLKKNMVQEGDISVDMLKVGRDVMLMNGVMGCIRGTIKELVE